MAIRTRSLVSLLLATPAHKRCRERTAGVIWAKFHMSTRSSLEAAARPPAPSEARFDDSRALADAGMEESSSSSPSSDRSSTARQGSATAHSSAAPTQPAVPPVPARLQQALRDAQVHLDKHYGNLRTQSEVLRKALAERAKVLGKEAEGRFAAIGGTINEVTGYKEVEKLKEQVRERELEIARLREVAAKAKITYDEAVTTRDTAQRSVTSLLERKHTWSDTDVHQFTSLVRADHSSNLTVAQTKVALLEAEANVEKAFDDMMKAILERYHEEQVWSDKIRSVSTYGSLTVLVVNLIVFIGAILVVEPWKRKTLVGRLEEKVSGMMENVEGHLARDLDSVKALLAAIPLAQAHGQGSDGASRTVDVPGELRVSVVPHEPSDGSTYGKAKDDDVPRGIGEDIVGEIQGGSRIELKPKIAIDPAQHNPSFLYRLAQTYLAGPLRDYFPAASEYVDENPRAIETMAASTGGVLGGIALTSIVMALLRSQR